MRISDWSSDVCSSDLTVTASAGIAYAQPSLGTLSLFATLTDSTYPNRRFGPALVQDGIRTLSGTVQLERRIGTRLQGGISVGYVSVDPELQGVKSLDGFSYGADLAYMSGGPPTLTLPARSEGRRFGKESDER